MRYLGALLPHWHMFVCLYLCTWYSSIGMMVAHSQTVDSFSVQFNSLLLPLYTYAYLYFCLNLCFSLSISLCLNLSLSLSVSFSLSLCLCLSFSPHLSLSPSLSVSPSLSPVVALAWNPKYQISQYRKLLA